MARLIIFDDCVRGVDLPDRAVIVGRSLKADVPIRDAILSRKHCTLVPDGKRFRFIDLKSANGSYVNGARVHRSPLHYDDIIEIGNTVMVLLEDDTWQRGDGLASLRNPLKAQELIQRIRMRVEQPEGNGANGEERDGRTRTAGERVSEREKEFVSWAQESLAKSPLSLELLEHYISHKIVSVLLRRLPELRETLADAMDRVLDQRHFQGDVDFLRGAIRDAISESFEAAGLAESTTSEGSAVDQDSSNENNENDPNE